MSNPNIVCKESFMSLESILNPSSVAIIGASRNPTKRGFQAIRTLLQEDYEGWIFPVNPKEKFILGLRCYPSVSEIDQPIDLAPDHHSGLHPAQCAG